MALIFHFKCTLKCCLQFVSIWTSLKFCVKRGDITKLTFKQNETEINAMARLILPEMSHQSKQIEDIRMISLYVLCLILLHSNFNSVPILEGENR